MRSRPSLLRCKRDRLLDPAAPADAEHRAAKRNYTDYCHPKVDKLVDQHQRMQPGKAQAAGMGVRKAVDRDTARLVIFYPRQVTHRHPGKGNDDEPSFSAPQ